MTEMLRTLSTAPRSVLTSEFKVFGVKLPELLFSGMIVTSLATGPWSDLQHPSDVFHWHNIVSALATMGACAVSFATGRLTAPKE